MRQLHTRWVLIKTYSETLKRYFPVWVSYHILNEKSFSPATLIERDLFGERISREDILCFEYEVIDRTTGFRNALVRLQNEQQKQLEKEAKKEQKESHLS